MPRKSLNRVLGEVLRQVLAERGMSDAQLGRRAGLSPRTIANYKKAADEKLVSSDSGKERSAKLSELEMIADALGVSPLYLLTDPQDSARRAQELATLIVQGAPVAAAEPTEAEVVFKAGVDFQKNGSAPKPAPASSASRGPKPPKKTRSQHR